MGFGHQSDSKKWRFLKMKISSFQKDFPTKTYPHIEPSNPRRGSCGHSRGKKTDLDVPHIATFLDRTKHP